MRWAEEAKERKRRSKWSGLASRLGGAQFPRLGARCPCKFSCRVEGARASDSESGVAPESRDEVPSQPPPKTVLVGAGL